MSDKELSIPWVERYRPTKIDNIILPEKTKQTFRNLIEMGGDKLPNFLFSGLSGIGKTTLAKALINELGVKNSLYINASDENGIDTIRTKVTGFCTSLTVENEIKILILDEADGLSFQGQKALNNIIESSTTTRFIFTCNYPEKILPALRSRLKEVVFRQVDVKDIGGMILKILKAEKIDTSDKKQRKMLTKLIKKFYPDMRKTINQLQYFCSAKTLDIDMDEVVADDTYELVLQRISERKVIPLWEVIRNNKLDCEGIIKRILHDTLDGKNLFTDKKLDNNTIGEIVVLCGMFTRYSDEVVDKEMNFVEFGQELMRIL